MFCLQIIELFENRTESNGSNSFGFSLGSLLLNLLFLLLFLLLLRRVLLVLLLMIVGMFLLLLLLVLLVLFIELCMLSFLDIGLSLLLGTIPY